MTKEQITAAVLDCLNSAFAADPSAIHSLIVNRVPCNQCLADHPQISVDDLRVLESSEAPRFTVGMGGVLGGLGRALGIGPIATRWSTPDPDDEGRMKFLGFCVVEDAKLPKQKPGGSAIEE